MTVKVEDSGTSDDPRDEVPLRCAVEDPDASMHRLSTLAGESIPDLKVRVLEHLHSNGLDRVQIVRAISESEKVIEMFEELKAELKRCV